jgi:ABC transporter transmembrane region
MHTHVSPGVLSARLEEDAARMSKATGMALGHKAQLVMTICLGIGISMAFSWQIALAATATIPLIGALTRLSRMLARRACSLEGTCQAGSAWCLPASFV